VSVEPFEAQLNGHPVTARASSDNIGTATRVNIGLDGRAEINDLLRKHYPQGLLYATGEADYKAEIRLFMNSDTGDAPPPSLHVSSDLRDIHSTLPAPLTKAAGKPVPFDLFVRFHRDAPAIASLAYDDWLRGELALTTDGSLDIQRADLQFDNGITLRLEDQPGIVMQGRLPELSIDGWRELQWPYGKGDGLISKLRFAELDVGRLTYLRRTISDIDVKVTQQLHNWQIGLDSELLRGEVLIPIDGFERRGLAINLKYFDFDQVNTGISDEAPSPHDVPPFQLSAERIILNGWRLDNLKVLAAPVERGVRFHTIRIEDPAVGLQGEGEWLIDSAQRHKSSLKLRFDSNDIGKGLESFGYARIIRGGQGSAEFDIGWAAAPSGFNFTLLQGTARIAVNDGQILDLEPGGGRLLGLLSLQTIPRRLALDFKDIFAKGFRFDKMRGSFSFSDGDAYTRDYYIDGPVGRIDIEGRTGLEARDYDQQVMFRPDLSSSLPLIGTLLGGATTGIAVILVDRIARVFGKQTDDLARVEYKLTGGWDAPELILVNRQSGKGKPKAATKKPDTDVVLPEISVEGS
jgi:uncharacterized protein YhdP